MSKLAAVVAIITSYPGLHTESYTCKQSPSGFLGGLSSELLDL